MKKAILDASALIAFVRNETGSDMVREWLAGSQLSAINYAETLQKLVDNEPEKLLLQSVISSCRISVVDFNQSLAERVANIYPKARKGISMADRACLALGLETGLPIVTGDYDWQKLDLDVELVMFRPLAN